MLNSNIETFIGCDKPYEEADIVIFGAPFDSTTSFRGGKVSVWKPTVLIRIRI